MALDEATCTAAVSEEHALLDPLSSVTEYGGVPPTAVTVATTVAVCPESISDVERATVGGPSAGLTVRVTVDEMALEPLELVTVPQ